MSQTLKISDGPEENRVDGCINILSRGEQPPTARLPTMQLR